MYTLAYEIIHIKGEPCLSFNIYDEDEELVLNFILDYENTTALFNTILGYLIDNET